MDNKQSQTVQTGEFVLVVQTISKPNATLEVKTVEIPKMVQAEIMKNLSEGKATRKDGGAK